MKNTQASVTLFFGLMMLPTAAIGQMSASEFETYVTGNTLYYGQLGQAYGVEEYLPDRRVRWSYLDGQCVDGRWFADGNNICFAYDGLEIVQCWQFFLGPGGLSARVSSDPEGEFLYEVEQSEEPMICLGPRIGV